MAGIKRKEAPAAKSISKNAHKKPKTVKSEVVSRPNTAPRKAAPVKSRPRDLQAEAETDSDPIVESETGEESGEDDGVSWPSDNEDRGVEVPASKSKKANGHDGGKAASKESKPLEKTNGTATTNPNSALTNSVVGLTAVANSYQAMLPEKPTLSKKYWPKNAKLQNQTPISLLAQRRSGSD